MPVAVAGIAKGRAEEEASWAVRGASARNPTAVVILGVGARGMSMTIIQHCSPPHTSSNPPLQRPLIAMRRINSGAMAEGSTLESLNTAGGPETQITIALQEERAVVAHGGREWHLARNYCGMRWRRWLAGRSSVGPIGWAFLGVFLVVLSGSCMGAERARAKGIRGAVRVLPSAAIGDEDLRSYVSLHFFILRQHTFF
ncbi:hypothetical protein EJ06DRAFT_159920 [Trichodelitschia bisporula]|uniref:Uncharacterized protein n=1 Tax=Trichodelitschia bisporula TaxID=703511 RepID=A0A6G1HMK6_9PEZI|nr:hypothetical protein EJ06DRAFT_159920 [Trichodelitschia bisporula]